MLERVKNKVNGTVPESSLMEQDFLRIKSDVQQNREEILRLNGELANLKSSTQGNVSDLRASVNAVSTKLEEKSKMIIPIIALILTMAPALWFIITTFTTSEISRALAPIESSAAVGAKQLDSLTGNMSSLQQITAGSAKADEASKTDRLQINDRVRQLESGLSREIGDRHAATVEERVKLGEIQTQFHADSDLGNLRTVWQHRINALLWEKAYPGEHYPSESFFPTTVFSSPSSIVTTTPP